MVGGVYCLNNNTATRTCPELICPQTPHSFHSMECTAQQVCLSRMTELKAKIQMVYSTVDSPWDGSQRALPIDCGMACTVLTHTPVLEPSPREVRLKRSLFMRLLGIHIILLIHLPNPGCKYGVRQQKPNLAYLQSLLHCLCIKP